MIVALIALIFLTKSISRLAIQKNESEKHWKWKVITGWIVGDLVGELIIYWFFGLNYPLLALFGAGLGYVGYLLVRRQLENIPDHKEF